MRRQDRGTKTNIINNIVFIDPFAESLGLSMCRPELSSPPPTITAFEKVLFGSWWFSCRVSSRHRDG
jgi:hypothetical protein